MGVLHPIVLPKPARSVQVAQIQLVERRAVGQQAVSRDRLRLDRLVVQQAAKKPQRRLRVPPALDHEVQDLAFVVDLAPQIYAPSADPADHLVRMPAGRRCRSAALQSLGDLRPELDRPASDLLIADLDPALGQEFLDVP